MASISVQNSQNTSQDFSYFLNLLLEGYSVLNSGTQRRARKSNLSISVENYSHQR